jgi:outer membrane translocation and assembly module TamA
MPEKLLPAVALVLGIQSMACSKIPQGRSAIDAVDIHGTGEISESSVVDKISTAETPKFLGLFRGVAFDYEVYDEAVLQRDLARIERYYQGHGYFDAHARAAQVLRKDDRHVRVEIYVEPGTPTRNRAVTLHGLEGVPTSVTEAARLAATQALPAGKPFDEDAYKAADIAVGRALTDRGFAHAKVERKVDLNIGAHTADYTFWLTPGPPSTFGPITITGLDPDGAGPRPQEIQEGPIRRALDIKTGTPYSTAQLDAATQALLDLGVFSAVHIVPKLDEPTPCAEDSEVPCPPAAPPSTVIPLTVELEPARLRSLKFGGGTEFDEIKTDLHLLTGWEHRNFLGGLRDFTIDASPGVVLFPIRINNYTTPIHPLPEERFRMQLRQPGFIEARTTGFIRPELNVFPLLVTPNPIPTAPVVGYLEPKAAVGVDRNVSKLFVSLSYNFQVEHPFSYPGTSALDPALSAIILSYPQLVTNLDFRDDAIHPHKGIFIGNNFQFAGGPFGGSAEDLREQPEVRFYVPLGRRVTFASRASVGFLFPFGGYYEPQLTTVKNGVVVPFELPAPNTNAGMKPADIAERKLQDSDIEIVYFRGFYSGGPNTNRGFPLRGIAPFGFVPFLSPNNAAAIIQAGCNPEMMAVKGAPAPTTPCTVPEAGLTLWEFSNEVRIEVSGPFATELFCDMGDASPHEANIRLGHLHLSCGAGASYDTPVGPIRVDVGYRIQPLQVLGYKNEGYAAAADPSNGIQPTIGSGKYALPIAIALGIGEAF